MSATHARVVVWVGHIDRRPFVGSGTGVELLYCPPCARMINEANGREVCALEVTRG